MVEWGKFVFDLFLYVVKICGFVLSDCLVLEDSVNGVKVVKFVGMIVVGFMFGNYCGEGYGDCFWLSGVDYVVLSYLEFV